MCLCTAGADEDGGRERVVHMAGDQVMGEGEVAEAEAPGVDGHDGRRGGCSVAQREFQRAAGLQVELVGGEFADGDGVLGELRQEPAVTSGSQVRVRPRV